MAAIPEEAFIRRIQQILRSSTDERERNWAAREIEIRLRSVACRLRGVDEDDFMDIYVVVFTGLTDPTHDGALREPGAFNTWLRWKVLSHVSAKAKKRRRHGPHLSLDRAENESPEAAQAREALELEIVTQPRSPSRTGASGWSRWQRQGVEHVVEERNLRSLLHFLLKSHVRDEKLRPKTWRWSNSAITDLGAWAFRYVIKVAAETDRKVQNTLVRLHTSLVFSYEFESEHRWSRHGWQEVRLLARHVIHALMDNLVHSGIAISDSCRAEVDPSRANTFDKRVRLLRKDLYQAFLEAGLVPATAPRKFHLEAKVRARRKLEKSRS